MQTSSLPVSRIWHILPANPGVGMIVSFRAHGEQQSLSHSVDKKVQTTHDGQSV